MSRNLHHRCPRSRGGTKNFPEGNCVRVNARRHYLWHCLFGNMTGESIAQDINTNWLDPRFKVVYRKGAK